MGLSRLPLTGATPGPLDLAVELRTRYSILRLTRALSHALQTRASRDRPNLMLAPIYVANPSAAVAFFEENIGGEYPYHVTGNNCQNYVFNGLRAGEAEITFPFIFIGRWNDPATTPTIPGKH